MEKYISQYFQIKFIIYFILCVYARVLLCYLEYENGEKSNQRNHKKMQNYFIIFHQGKNREQKLEVPQCDEGKLVKKRIVPFKRT